MLTSIRIMLFRKPRDEFKRYASHVQGLHGLLRPAQVDQDVNEDKVDDHGQWSMVMVMVMIMMILGCRVSADAAQLLATKFSSSTCGSGFTYTAGRLFSLIIKMLVLEMRLQRSSKN